MVMEGGGGGGEGLEVVFTLQDSRSVSIRLQTNHVDSEEDQIAELAQDICATKIGVENEGRSRRDKRDPMPASRHRNKDERDPREMLSACATQRGQEMCAYQILLKENLNAFAPESLLIECWTW
eukprot:3135566-Rhodomonas_salina.2